MIEIILLAGTISVELEPYAVENPEPDSHAQEMNTETSDRGFQWTTRSGKSGDSPLQDTKELDNFGNRVDRDAHGRRVEAGEQN